LPSPRCPVITLEKAWIERRMLWLADQFGRDRLLGATFVLPDERHFPEPHDGSRDGARRLLDRLCGFMGVDPGAVDLEVGPAPAPSGRTPPRRCTTACAICARPATRSSAPTRSA
jgi:hypothetical protein